MIVHEFVDLLMLNYLILESQVTLSSCAVASYHMQVYRRDLEEGGVVVDPLKAQLTVQVSIM